MEARRAEILVDYQGVNITEEVQKDLLSFEYTDNASGESDSISLSLKDDKHVWLKDWFPEKGDTIIPIVQTTNWRRDKDKQRLPCGRFFIDQPEYSGRPSEISLNGIASPLNRNFKDTDRTKNWRNISVRAIAKDIAIRAGLSLNFIGSNNPQYITKEQSETPDSTFLSELCEEEGLAMKLTDSQIIIFDEREFEKIASVTTLFESSDIVLSYGFSTSLSNTKYDGVKVSYYDSSIGKNIEFIYSLSDIDEESKIYKVNQKVSSGSQARRLAQRTLRKLNKTETRASLSVVGNVELLGSVCVDLEGFGAFDGKYYIQQSSHSIGNGYTTSLEMRKVLEGY